LADPLLNIPRALEIPGALLVLLGSLLEWKTESGGIAGNISIEYRGYELAEGWIVIACGLLTLLLQRTVGRLAFNALPAMLGGLVIFLFAWKVDNQVTYPDGLSANVEIGAFVPFIGCAFIGAGSLIAFGMILGARDPES
jgi:hypothetical protein